MALVVDPSVALLLERLENQRNQGTDSIFLGAFNEPQEKAKIKNRVMHIDPQVINMTIIQIPSKKTANLCIPSFFPSPSRIKHL